VRRRRPRDRHRHGVGGRTYGERDERPGRLVVDPRLHAGEIARFTSHVVCGPTASDCNIWTGAIGADGYFITRSGMGFCVRPNRYALALATGSALGADVFASHECDNPVCVKVSGPSALCEHVVAGTQFDNMRRIARARCGGGRPTIRGLGREARRARSVALREAVQGGVWDGDAVANTLLGVEPRLF
jgi:hypothetical protein